MVFLYSQKTGGDFAGWGKRNSHDIVLNTSLVRQTFFKINSYGVMSLNRLLEVLTQVFF